jgi:hypothetical protein
MLYVSFLKRLTPILAVNMVKRLQEVIGSQSAINWSSEQPFRHNLFQVLNTLCTYLKGKDIQFFKTVDEDEVLFFLEVRETQSYFLEIFDKDITGFQEFLMRPKNLNLIKDDPHLTLNLQKLLIELYFFVTLEKKLNKVLEAKRNEYLEQPVEEIKADETLHTELLLMAANLKVFATKMAHQKNYSDAGLTEDVFNDFQNFITQLNQAILGTIETSEAIVAPLANMKYSQVFFDPLFALGTALLDYILSKNIQASTVDYSPPQSMLVLSSSTAHFLRMSQSMVAGTLKLVANKTLSTQKIEQNQTAIWKFIEYYYTQFLSRKSVDFKANLETARRELTTTKNDFESNRGFLASLKGVVKGNDFPRVLDAALTWLDAMEANVKYSDKSWCGQLDFAYFESGQPPSRELALAKYLASPSTQTLPVVSRHSEDAHASQADSDDEEEEMFSGDQQLSPVHRELSSQRKIQIGHPNTVLQSSSSADSDQQVVEEALNVSSTLTVAIQSDVKAKNDDRVELDLTQTKTEPVSTSKKSDGKKKK